ncbi:MAG: hypothetical protein Q9207_005086 [Kuettlingeria erythrocarpa]
MSFVSETMLFLLVAFALSLLHQRTTKPRGLLAWSDQYLRLRLHWGFGNSKKIIPGPSASPSQLSGSLPASEAMHVHKTLYHQLQNIEKHPEVLPQARDLLVSLLAEAVGGSQETALQGILAIQEYDSNALATFLKEKDDRITVQWENYLSRRKAGKPREMFKDREHAEWWLRQSAPVKYVDGAWLGHIHKVSTPFALRSITKNVWQILSEELGDGDLVKNHVHVYRELMAEIGHPLPAADSRAFVDDLGMDAPQVWKAAVAQLLISLFPHEFLPEILGFNMHFEMLTWDTMRAIKELKELGLNDYYFLLHVSIDNADSGHTAMAMQSVIEYMEYIHEYEGALATQQAWRRIQAGYLLSETLSSSPGCVSSGTDFAEGISFNKNEVDITKVFKAKALVAHRLHCSSKVKIKGRTLVEWLEPGAFASRKRQKAFIDALAESKPWIYKGDPEKSRLVKELAWDGKMFGSFTQVEVGALRRWIESLAVHKPDPKYYWAFTGRTELSSESALRGHDLRVDYPVFPALPKLDLGPEGAARTIDSPICVEGSPQLRRFIGLWFAQSCVLEGLITIPFRTANPASSAIIRVLRAQYGFAPEGSGVAGMDEMRRTDAIDLHSIGVEVTKNTGIPQPRGLQDALRGEESVFAVSMLALSMRPIEHRDTLLGMAWAFMRLHEALATSASTRLLTPQTKAALRDIARRELLGLQVFMDELKADQARRAHFGHGFNRVRREIEEIFS